MTPCDFVVVGAGVAGLSVAYELTAHGRVIVLERENTPAYHTTGRSAALYAGAYGDDPVSRLIQASRPFFESPPKEIAPHSLLAPRGALYLARSDQLAKLARAEAEARELPTGTRALDFKEAAATVPVLRADYVAAALYEPEVMDIDVPTLLDGYLRALSARAGRLVTSAEVRRLEREDGRWRIETETETFHAPSVVNAAGAWADKVAALAGVRCVGLAPKRRTVISFDPPPEVDARAWPVVCDIDDEFYFKPEADRLWATPQDETPTWPGDAQPDPLDVAVTVERIERATTIQIQQLHRQWAGLRSFVEDRLPVAGMDEDAAGFFWLAGQGGYGIQAAPALARVVAGLAVAGKLTDELHEVGLQARDFAPGRLHR